MKDICVIGLFLVVLISITNIACSDTEIVCGNNASLVDGECKCNPGFIGVDCSFELSLMDPCREKDSLLLVSFYNSMQGDNWDFSIIGGINYSPVLEEEMSIPNFGNRWDFDKPISTYHGIELNYYLLEAGRFVLRLKAG